jgi:hypothetical protein
MSGKHCKIFKDGTIIFLEDLSSNGTYINGVKVGKGNRSPLKEGDELSLLIPNSSAAASNPKFTDSRCYLFVRVLIYAAFVAFIFKFPQKGGTTNLLDVRVPSISIVETI